MDDSVKKMLQEKYAEQLGNINTGQAFANLGDVIAGRQIGSTNPYFTEQRGIAKDQTLGEYDREQARLLKEAHDKQMLQLKLMELAQKKSEGESNRDLKKMIVGEQLGAKKQKEQELSAAQAKQLGLAEMGNLANKQYEEAVKEGFNPTSYGSKIDLTSWAPQFLKSDVGKKAVAAQDSWVESFLRDASGAAIPVSERSNYYPIYFPIPGDTPDVIANKKEMRALKEKVALQGAGKGANKFESVSKAPTSAPKPKSPVKKQYSASRNQTKIVYSDGSEEVVNGKQ